MQKPTPPKKKEAAPIYTSNPKDPRIRAYNDSLYLYSQTKGYREWPEVMGPHFAKIVPYKNNTKYELSESKELLSRYSKIKPEKTAMADGMPMGGIYKRPVQEVIFKPATKPAEKPAKKPIVKDAAVSKPSTKPVEKPVSKPATKPVEKPIATAKPKTTPTVTVKEISEDKANALKNQYKESTGSTYKSKDEIYNNLQKTLKRKPTVKEYNDAVQRSRKKKSK